MRWLLTFVGFNAVLLIVVLLALWAFGGFAGSGLSGQGWIALALGIALTSGVGVALMALVFHSARGHYDEDAYRIGPPRD
jgi:hypothetical protein